MQVDAKPIGKKIQQGSAWTRLIDSLSGKGKRPTWQAIGANLLTVEVYQPQTSAPLASVGKENTKTSSKSPGAPRSRTAGAASEYATAIAEHFLQKNLIEGGKADLGAIGHIAAGVCVGMETALAQRHSSDLFARKRLWRTRIIKIFPQMFRQATDRASSARDGVVKGLDESVAEVRSKKILYARALDAAIGICSELNKHDTSFGGTLLRYVREWNALGNVGDAWMDRRREICLLRYVGLDEGYLRTYDDKKNWARSHADDKKAANDFMWTAHPLADALAADGRFDDAVGIFEDIVSISLLVEKDRQIISSAILRNLETALSSKMCSPADAEKTLKRIAAVDPSPATQQRISAEIIELSLQPATEASKRGDFKGAIKGYKEVLTKNPDLKEAQIGLAWTIEKQLKQLADQHKMAVKKGSIQPNENREELQKTIGELAANYLALNKVERPLLVHSLILTYATQLAELMPGYVDFVRHCGVDSLRPDDFRPFLHGDRSYESLAQKVAHCLYRKIKDRQPSSGRELDDGLRFVISFIEQCRARCPQENYIAYYHARLLLLAGDKQKARTILTEQAIRLSTEFWFWTALADGFKGEDDESRRACLAKAALMVKPRDRKYAHALRRDLQFVFKDHPEYHKGSDNTALFKKYTGLADDIASSALLWLPAVVLSLDVERGLSVWFKDKDAFLVAKGIVDVGLSAELKRGAAVNVKVVGVAPDIMVVNVKARRAQAWNILPWVDAVVTHKLSARRSVKLLLADGVRMTASARSWRQVEEWEPGIILKIKVLPSSVGGQIVASKQMRKSPRFVKQVTGTIDRIDNEGQAWIDKTTCVPRRLTAHIGLVAGDKVRLTAVQSEKDRWDAIIAVKS